MVVVNLKGGLGNQLFQYASATAIARSRDQELVFDIEYFENDAYSRQYALIPFKIDNRTFSKSEVLSLLDASIIKRVFNLIKTKTNKRYYCQVDYEIDLSILKANPKDQYLNGYFANPSYFEGIRGELLCNITLKESYQSELFKQKLEWIKKNKFISVHIRRSDYISDKSASQLFEALDKEYYNRCIDFFKTKIDCSKKFLFFSDDIEWVKKQFENLDQSYFIEEPELYKDYFDIMFMAACEHNIIANSTFSWWGAWLNKNHDKVVLAPKKWYRNSQYQALYEKSTFLPNSWILI